jgi:peptidoglycan hydrolase-like protein with peptidoglycan-binding domain
LKNAGYYAGAVDGKIGPITKKAIEEFQKANNLKADGKVGPKTWELLKGHLNPPQAAEKKR